MAHSISFQYLQPGADMPRAGYELTDGGFDLPAGAAVPRVGEFVQLIEMNSTETYEVLAVTTRIFSVPDQPPGFHSVVTVGPIVGEEKAKLSVVRE